MIVQLSMVEYDHLAYHGLVQKIQSFFMGQHAVAARSTRESLERE